MKTGFNSMILVSEKML